MLFYLRQCMLKRLLKRLWGIVLKMCSSSTLFSKYDVSYTYVTGMDALKCGPVKRFVTKDQVWIQSMLEKVLLE